MATAAAGPRRPLEVSEALDLVAQAHARSAILVEGWSDEAAVKAWARTCAVGQLKRFLGTRAGRKVRYGALLASALCPDRAPLPLRRVLAQALA